MRSYAPQLLAFGEREVPNRYEGARNRDFEFHNAG